MSPILILSVVIFIIIVIVVILVIIYFTPSPTITDNTGTFLAPCLSNNSCLNGLICDPTSNLCKLIDGTICTQGSDCLSTSFCSGRCTTGQTGGINDFCPCDVGNICINNKNTGYNTCKGGVNVSCTSNSDCASGFCSVQGEPVVPCDGTSCVCTAGLPLAAVCVNNSDCESQNCSNGFCQPKHIISGTVGSYCTNNVCPGYTGSQCNNGLECLCPLDNGPGVCSTSQNGLLSPCTTTNPCPSPMVCEGIQGCQYSNTQSNVCVNGMTSNVTIVGDCYNNNQIGCISNTDCFTSNCSGNGALTVYLFDNTVTNNFPLTQNIELLNVSTYSSTFNCKKIFALSNSFIDTIYYVDLNIGLLALQYNTNTKTVVFDWSILIPYSNPGIGNLVDAIVDQNSNIYVVINNGLQDVVYTFDGVSFNLFNGGIQLDTLGNPISIQYIDISLNNDILLAGISGGIYIKSSSDIKYTLQTVNYTAGNPRFYNGSSALSTENFVYINGTGTDGAGLVIFNGEQVNPNLATGVINFNINPTATATTVVVSTLQNSSSITEGSQNYGAQNNVLYTNLPGRFSSVNTGLSLVTNYGYYVLTPSSCV